MSNTNTNLVKEKVIEIKKTMISDSIERLYNRFVEAYQGKPVNTDSKNFIDCEWCELCVPKFCYIHYKNEDDEIDDVDCLHCLLRRATKNNKIYVNVVLENMKDITNCINRMEESNNKFRKDLNESNEFMIFKKVDEKSSEEDEDDGVLPCGCIDTCRGRCMSYRGRKELRRGY